MKKVSILVLFLLTTVSTFAANSSVKLNVSLWPAGSFVAKTSLIKGKVYSLGNNSFTAENIQLDIGSLKTGISLRDNHMANKYFEVKKYPKATLLSANGKDGKFTGKLKIHNTVCEVSGSYILKSGILSVKFKTKMS